MVFLPRPETSSTRLRFVCLVLQDELATVLALRNTVPVGSLDWNIARDDGEIVHVEVLPVWQRKGVATRMLRAAEEISRDNGWPAPGHSTTRTRDGDAWARSLGADPAVTVEEREGFERERRGGL